MTQKQVAEKVGVSYGAVKTWEHGAPVSPKYIAALSAALNLVLPSAGESQKKRAEFADGLKKAMGRHGYNQSSLAAALNISRQAVSLWLQGKAMPSAKKQALMQQLIDYPSGVICVPRASRTRSTQKKGKEKDVISGQNPRIGVTGRMRLDAGLTLKELSGKTGISETALSHLECSPIVPHDSTILLAAQACGVSPEKYGVTIAPLSAPYAALGEKLYQLRCQKGISQSELERLAGISGYCLTEQGLCKPRRKRLALLANVLDCPVQELEQLINKKEGS